MENQNQSSTENQQQQVVEQIPEIKVVKARIENFLQQESEVDGILLTVNVVLPTAYNAQEVIDYLRYKVKEINKENKNLR